VSSFNDLEASSTSCQPGVAPDLDSHLIDGDDKFCFCNIAGLLAYAWLKC